jgi:hypothetical protein
MIGKRGQGFREPKRRSHFHDGSRELGGAERVFLIILVQKG